MDFRIVLFILLVGLCCTCIQRSDVGNNNLVRFTPSPTPIQELVVLSGWERFEIGPFTVLGPTNMKKKNIKGEDSEIYEYEDWKFSFQVAMGMYECVDGKLGPSFYEHEKRSIMINGNAVDFIKSDVNKSASNAATNADGSRSKPVEKHFVLEACIPEKNALVSVSYTEESSTQLAMAMLQSIRLRKE